MLLDSVSLSAMPFGKFTRRVVLPVSVLVIGAIGLVIAVVLVSAVRQDRIALEASTRLAQTALAVKSREIGRNLKDYAVWEDAYNNLHVNLDLDWAATDGNVGANILGSLGYEMGFVVDSKGGTVYAVLDGVPTRADAHSLFPNGLSEMVRQATQANDPIVGLLRSSESEVVLVASTSILPPAGLGQPPDPGERSVLIFGKKLQGQFLDRIRLEYLLDDVQLVDVGASGSGASLPLTSPSGVNLGEIRWTPDQPGRELLRVLLLPLMIALIGLGAFAWLVLRNAKRSASAIEVSARTIQAYAHTLEQSESRFRDVAEASSDWIWEADPEFRLTFLSTRFNEVTGIAAATVLGRTLEQFFSSDTESEGWAQLRGDTRLHNTFRDLRCCYRDAEGSRRYCRIAGRPILDATSAFIGYRGTATDITQEVEAEARANHLALHDSLTQLPNRVLFRERVNLGLAAMDRDGSQVAVLCLDLDYFKVVNDTLGHGAGDMLLNLVADRLRTCVRNSDTIARLGGDEFAIVQSSRDQPHDAESLCRRVLEIFKAPFSVDTNEMFVGVSIGVALAPIDGQDQEHLLKNADIALYRAKQAGRGTFRMFESQMDAELQERKALEQALRQAIANQQFEIHYQPLITVQGQKLAGVEALLRWRRPERGLVAPSEFIPVAEETGLIVPIGEWVLRTACEQVKAWPGMYVAVNLSPVQFKHQDLPDTIQRILNETELDPRRLELEITESVLLYDTRGALEILGSLKALGVTVAMDDFGTGYSSLGYLNCFPFDKIKIDRSFVSSLGQAAKSDAIVRSVLSLGDSLRMVTIAEGVETLEQLTFLEGEGCKQIQGFYYGKPMPADELTRLRSDWMRIHEAAA